ncbi:LOW QUALITY PROTEIN: hypothetical protein U9M48_032212 [Paspalum notatum var. saurae]|uniref:Uncharacterized protein n=1 Tax=Paspalum notatum var. saurae TaxID=547442 RepID=A0AAQ3U8B5_PASNO
MRRQGLLPHVLLVRRISARTAGAATDAPLPSVSPYALLPLDDGTASSRTLSSPKPTGPVPAAETFEAVLCGNLRFPPRAFAAVSPEAKDLLPRMLCRDPSRKFSADQGTHGLSPAGDLRRRRADSSHGHGHGHGASHSSDPSALYIVSRSSSKRSRCEKDAGTTWNVFQIEFLRIKPDMEKLCELMMTKDTHRKVEPSIHCQPPPTAVAVRCACCWPLLAGPTLHLPLPPAPVRRAGELRR